MALTSPLSFFVTQENPALGTLVAIVGMRASCQPIPVLMMLAPASSMFLASRTISSLQKTWFGWSVETAVTGECVCVCTVRV